MEMFNNERVIQRGEEFNLDILLSQSTEEYIPFLISSERTNPMFVCTVSSTVFERGTRQIVSYWNDIFGGPRPWPKFFQTVVEELWPENDNPGDPFEVGIVPTQPAGTLGNPLHAVFRWRSMEDTPDPITGKYPWRWSYWEYEDETAGTIRMVTHTEPWTHLRFNFRSEVTQLWNSQNYLYQILLVDGHTMVQSIISAHANNLQLDWPADWPVREQLEWIEQWKLDNPFDPGVHGSPEAYEELSQEMEAEYWTSIMTSYISQNHERIFKFITDRLPTWFAKDIDHTSPLGLIHSQQIILPPTKLMVNQNLAPLNKVNNTLCPHCKKEV